MQKFVIKKVKPCPFNLSTFSAILDSRVMTITIIGSLKNSNMLLFSFYDLKEVPGVENFQHSMGKMFCFGATYKSGFTNLEMVSHIIIIV